MDHDDLNAALRRQDGSREYQRFVQAFAARNHVELEVADAEWPEHIEDQFRMEYREFKLMLSATDEMGEWTPNCPEDLVQMEIVGRGQSTRWQCPACGFAKLS